MLWVLAAQEGSINWPMLLGFLGILAFCLSFHESAHAWAALRCGDTTGRDLGRITLNPIPHIDPIGTVLLPILLYIGSNGAFCFGCAKPVPVNVARLRSERDWAFVAAAGPISNILLALLGAAMLVFLRPFVQVDSFGFKLLLNFYLINIVLAAFNMIPIPPLDGSRILRLFLPQHMKAGWDRLENFGFVILIVFIFWLDGTRFFVTPAINGALEFVSWLWKIVPL